ncbi:hypothetical protein ABT381_05195 [Streptomyces sp. NPDC000151]|uniref:hypothetical protein n=1 Tax=Streptomyces sp. NPDC000151 TaxID=3154244 RepID=UPI00331B85D7
MRAFCRTLLAGLAVLDALAKLDDSSGLPSSLDAETLTSRPEQLVRWGNLSRSSHTVKAFEHHRVPAVQVPLSVVQIGRADPVGRG